MLMATGLRYFFSHLFNFFFHLHHSVSLFHAGHLTVTLLSSTTLSYFLLFSEEICDLLGMSVKKI